MVLTLIPMALGDFGAVALTVAGVMAAVAVGATKQMPKKHIRHLKKRLTILTDTPYFWTCATAEGDVSTSLLLAFWASNIKVAASKT